MKHNIQDCPAPCCAVCKKDHHTLICPEEKREQKLHKAEQEEEDSGDEENDQDFYGNKDLFESNLQFHFSNESPEYDDGDDYEDDYQDDDEYDEEQDQSGDVQEDGTTDRSMFVKSPEVVHGKVSSRTIAERINKTQRKSAVTRSLEFRKGTNMMVV